MADMIKQGVHGFSEEERYVRPQDPLLQERLEWFQDQKLALMMHFGIYTQMGINASWPLSDGDAHWSRRQVDWVEDGDEFREQYKGLKKSFNPVCFNPEAWADMAARNGFKYLIFTTKHHDGFCMYDTQYTDYKVTSEECPFHTHKYADITRSVFDAFRKRGIAIAPYFSKPDWHCPWYWAEGVEKPVAYDRNCNYTPSEHPEVWEQFVQFTHNQLMELVENYGRIDILWLDGGWVNAKNGQDIRLSELLERARKVQPWLLSADRAVGGENENYITPEQTVPSRPIRVPWESCLTVGRAFEYFYEEKFKTPRELVHLLINVVSRGGNLALNIAPQPNGTLPAPAIRAVDGMGAWLRVNGEAIYGTRIAEVNESGYYAFTKKGEVIYALHRLPECERLGSKALIPWKGEVSKVTLLGLAREIPFRRVEGGIEVEIPFELRGSNPIAPAYRLEK